MDRASFLKLISTELFPSFRAEGFKGSGSTLRRIQDPVIHVFNVQGSTSADRCYLNVGAHLSFLPAEGGLPVEPKSFLEYHCTFRDRIDPPAKGMAWSYGRTIEEARATIASMLVEWGSQGKRFFERYKTYPGSFLKLVETEDPRTVHPSMALRYAKIAMSLQRVDLAMTYASEGLAAVPVSATLLKEELTNVLASLNAP